MKFAFSGRALGAALVAAVLVSCGKTDGPPVAARSAMPARSVRLARAETRPLERVLAVLGTLAAQEQSTLSAKVAGRVQRLVVDLGSVVREGDLLAQVEPRDYELRLQQSAAALAQARAALGLPATGDDDAVAPEQSSSVKQTQAVLDEASKNRQRVVNLSQAGIASPADLDTAESVYMVASSRRDAALEEARTRVAALAQRRAEFEIARKQLADASVRAPFDGAVQARLAGLGEYVAAGTPIITLVKTDPLRLRLEVPERESVAVRVGQVVRLHVEGDTNVYTGQLARLSPALTEQNRMLRVEADVPQRGSLRAGLFAHAEIVLSTDEPGLTVPPAAITTFAGLEKVVVIQDGKAVEKTVTTGRRGTGWVEVISGLAVGEAVVLDPVGLRSGQPVTVGEPAARPAPQTAATPRP